VSPGKQNGVASEKEEQEQECKHKTTAAAKTAPCLQSFAVKKLKNKVK